MLSPARVRILAGVVLGALSVLDIVYRSAIQRFVGTHPLAGIIACALMAVTIATLLNWLVVGQLSLDEAYHKWLAEPSTSTVNIIMLAALLFVALLLRYSLISFFDLTPTVLVFIAIFICVIGLWRLKGTGRSGDERKRDIAITIRVLLIGLLFGLYLVVAAVGYAPKENAVTVERTAMGWALAYFAALFLVGFLFGIPRVLQGDAAADVAKKMGYEQRVNTNLEQISDWLTKIIVGLGLVELRTVPEKLQNAAKWMAQSFASPGTPPSDAVISFAGAFIIFFSVLGFLAGYLTTRLFLSPAFYRADVRTEVVVALKTEYSTGDPTVERIRKYSQASPENRRKLEQWLASKGKSAVKIAEFISDPQYANLRVEAINDNALNVP